MFGALVVWFWSNPEDPWACCHKGRGCVVCEAMLVYGIRRLLERAS